MEKKRKAHAHLSKEQKRTLLELVQEKPQLRSGKFTKDFTYKQAQSEWEEISIALNAIPGSEKDWRLWRKTWQDLQCKAKAKKAAFTKAVNRTGGGPQPEQLDDFEEGVVALINNNSIMGHAGVTESVVEFVEIYQQVDENFEDSTVLPPPTFGIPDEPTYEEGSIANELIVVPPPPPAVELQTSNATASTSNQGQGNANGNNKATKINMKSLLKEKVELKRKLVESTIKFQQEYIRIQDERNEILKDIENKLS